MGVQLRVMRLLWSKKYLRVAQLLHYDSSGGVKTSNVI